VPEPESIEPKSESTSLPPSEPDAAANDGLSRVSFYVTASGEPVWDRMHATTREKVQKLRGMASTNAPASSALNPLVSKALSNAAVASVPVLVQIVLRFLGFTPESVSQVKLTDDQRAELGPLYAAALADYNVALGKHENLIVALGMTGMMLAPALEQLKRAPKNKPNGSAGGPLIPMMEQPEPPAA
jgi:hypothetical protein